MVLEVKEPWKDSDGRAGSRPVVAIADRGVEARTRCLLGPFKGREQSAEPIGGIGIGRIEGHSHFLPFFAGRAPVSVDDSFDEGGPLGSHFFFGARAPDEPPRAG